jgi:hypothetical protein
MDDLDHLEQMTNSVSKTAQDYWLALFFPVLDWITAG